MRVEVTPDIERAKALLKMAQITIERLGKTAKEKYPSNTLIDYYDIIHKLLEAIACVKGVKFRGDGAHQQLIDFVCGAYLSPMESSFLQDMREYRNRIQYEGFVVDADYILLNATYIETIIQRLTNPLQV